MFIDQIHLLPKVGWEKIKHNVPGRARHPAVVFMNRLTALLTGLVWFIGNTPAVGWDLSLGTQLFFLAQLNLYCGSSWFHTVKETRASRAYDQASIGIFIIVATLPFVWQKPVAVVILGVSILAFVEYKTRDYDLWLKNRYGEDRAELVGSLAFLTGGVVSLTVYFTFGETMSGPRGTVVFWFAIICFILKLMTHIFWKRLRLKPDYVEKSEIGHPILALAMICFDWHVLTEAP
ncbi:hypothetical protein KC845_02665 [Candidatus Kaiserbacteria bacterium]|nr:hypothetical protein [Candidatus Kaiserbacteria bacterium]